MRLTKPLACSQQAPSFQINNEKTESNGFHINTLESIYHSSQCLPLHRDHNPYEKSANIIKRFLKKVIAAQSVANMFSNGTDFKELGTYLLKTPEPKFSFNALEHLDSVSQKYLSEIKSKTQNLTHQEIGLLSKITNSKPYLRHQSNSDQNAQKLNLFSKYKLDKENIGSSTNTNASDVQCLSNHDFVFFAVEFSDDISKAPLNTLHNTVDFGANAYILDELSPYGYMTLTDHFYNEIQQTSEHEHQKFIAQFPKSAQEVHRKVHAGDEYIDVPIYNTKDMKLAVGLHLIQFLRQSQDEAFKKFALNDELDNDSLDKIINYVFQLEFHVPRMVSTENFKKVKLREMTLTEAVNASNINMLSKIVNNKNEACEAMKKAIALSKADVVSYLFSHCDFNVADTLLMTSNDEELEYLLSNPEVPIYITEQFLVRKLIAPNKPFTKQKIGSTMLEQALIHRNKEMIALLMSYGINPLN